MQVGASVTDRTLLDTAYETVANTTILAGNQGGPPPAYDPCATFNPVFTIGANSLALNQDTSTTLEGCSAPIYKANYFKFVPPIDGDYTFSTCASGADTRMAVLNGCAAGSTILACNDDSSCGVGSTITIAMTAGTPYYVVIGRANADTALPSPIAATLSSPPNPACGQAVTASFGANPFDNTGSTLAQSVKANATGTSSATINKTIWYAFTPAVTGAYKFSLCGATGDTMLAVGVDCPNYGSRFEALGFNDDAPCNGAASSQSFVDATNNGATGTYAGFPLTQDLVAGTRYLVIAGSWSATSNITGTLLIDGPPPPPADPADLDGNGVVDALDLAALLGAWGTSGVPADINDDGIVDALDLAELLGRWTF